MIRLQGTNNYIKNIYDSVRTKIGVYSSNRYDLKSRFDLKVFTNRYPFLILRYVANLLVSIRVRITIGHTSVKSFDVDLKKWETAIYLTMESRIGIEITLRYKYIWRRNRTWIWGLDVDLCLTYISTETLKVLNNIV